MTYDELQRLMRSADRAREDVADAAGRWRDRPDEDNAAALRRAVDDYRGACRLGAVAFLELARSGRGSPS